MVGAVQAVLPSCSCRLCSCSAAAGRGRLVCEVVVLEGWEEQGLLALVQLSSPSHDTAAG